MNNQSELGGAQALLQLGSKNKKSNKKSNSSDVEESIDEDLDSKATNQQINDAVEAAVMRYVGGNLDNDDKKQKKRNEDLANMGDFQHWAGFLDDGIEHQDEDFDYKSPKKKKRRISSTNEVDPELSGLDTNSEHDQLVRAAILETRELAKQLGTTYNSLNNLPVHQAQQVMLALQNNSNPDSIAHINHLAQFGKDLPNVKPPFRSFDYKPVEGSINDGEQSKDFSHIGTLFQLSDEAQKIALTWFKDQPESKGPRSFSPEEQKAVDYFITGYGYLMKMDRKGVCARIWSSERKKDNFWECLTRVLPYRSRASVYKHVRRQYHVFDVRGKWTAEDDDKLGRLAATRTGNWKEIGSIMGRMPEDCRDRWRNYIKCGQNRVQSKWSVDEENKLKQVVTDMLSNLKLNSINWTLVSEAMEGTRSRIQCRYKWNKLVKRESLDRVSFMDLDTKLWLFEKLKTLNYQSTQEVDWNLVSKLSQDELKPQTKWLPSDFEYGFDKLKTAIKDFKLYELPELLDHLIEDCLEKRGNIDDKERDYMWR